MKFFARSHKGDSKWRRKERNRLKADQVAESRICGGAHEQLAVSKKKRTSRHRRMIELKNTVGDDARDARLAQQNRTPGPDGH